MYPVKVVQASVVPISPTYLPSDLKAHRSHFFQRDQGMGFTSFHRNSNLHLRQRKTRLSWYEQRHGSYVWSKNFEGHTGVVRRISGQPESTLYNPLFRRQVLRIIRNRWNQFQVFTTVETSPKRFPVESTGGGISPPYHQFDGAASDKAADESDLLIAGCVSLIHYCGGKEERKSRVLCLQMGQAFGPDCETFNWASLITIDILDLPAHGRRVYGIKMELKLLLRASCCSFVKVRQKSDMAFRRVWSFFPAADMKEANKTSRHYGHRSGLMYSFALRYISHFLFNGLLEIIVDEAVMIMDLRKKSSEYLFDYRPSPRQNGIWIICPESSSPHEELFQSLKRIFSYLACSTTLVGDRTRNASSISSETRCNI